MLWTLEQGLGDAFTPDAKAAWTEVYTILSTVMKDAADRMTVTVNADRLWTSIMKMAEIGPIPGDGSCRLALTAEDAAARRLLLDWCQALGLRHEQDAIGNMFLRRAGQDAAAKAVAFGSHLDTVPTGGRFDGIAGVLAGLGGFAGIG